jgi:hypothetical protein
MWHALAGINGIMAMASASRKRIVKKSGENNGNRRREIINGVSKSNNGNMKWHGSGVMSASRKSINGGNRKWRQRSSGSGELS